MIGVIILASLAAGVWVFMDARGESVSPLEAIFLAAAGFGAVWLIMLLAWMIFLVTLDVT